MPVKNIWLEQAPFTRERIDQLIDVGTAFLEIGQLAAYNVYEDDVPAAGVIAGIGQVNDIRRVRCQ